MKAAPLFLAITALNALACVVLCANEPVWNRDFDRAKEAAKSEDRPLFILFTGHGWCHACEVVDREVFRTEKFIQATTGKYVFAELDFNFGDGPEEEKRKSKAMQLRSHYLAPAVPTVVLADSEGRPYAFITGYDPDSGPERYLNLLATAEHAKEKRDKLFSAAAEESGKSRAELLDNALDAVAPLLGEIDIRGDDALLRFYGETIREILELADDDEPIARKYFARQNHRVEWLSSKAVFARLKDFKSTKDYAGAINYIEGCLKSTTSDPIRWRLESSKQFYLERSDRNAEALENCRRVLALDGIPKEYRESFLDREAYNLFRLDRVAEGLAHYDRRIADAADDRERRLHLLHWKAQMVYGRDPVSQSIAAWEAYRTETESGTDRWLTATALLARELRRANSHERALQVIEEYLQEDRGTWVLLGAAESYLALGNLTKYRKYIEEAAAANRNLADSERQSERQEFERVTARIDELTRKLEDASAPPQINGTKP